MTMQPMLTTVDNPWNPATHWDEWIAFDIEKGYNTNGLLARFTNSPDTWSDNDQMFEIEDEMDRIIELNPMGVHKKIFIDRGD